MNEKIIDHTSYQESGTVVTPTYTLAKAKLVSFQGKKYAINPQAIFTINCTSECNAQCFFCYNGITFMRTDRYCSPHSPELKRAIQFAISAGITTASISGGEPTICPKNLITLIKRLKQLGMSTVRLHTNGLLLGQSIFFDESQEPLWRLLKDYGLDEISISLADYRQNKNRSIMRIDNLSALKKIIPDLLKTDMKVRLSCYLCPQGIFTKDDIVNYILFANTLGVSNIIFRKTPSSRKADLLYFDDIESELSANGWRVNDHIEKSDAIIDILSRDGNQIVFSCVCEEPDPDAKIRRLIYMPDQVLYTSWIEPSSFLFHDDAKKIVYSLVNPQKSKTNCPGSIWNPPIPQYIYQNINQTIDMHVHSMVSDGLDAPSQVLRNAANAGIKMLVFTEHNCLHDSTDELITAANHFEINIPLLGVELSTVYCENNIPKLKFHLLIYGKQKKQLEFIKNVYNPNEPRNQYLKQQYQYAFDSNLLTQTWDELFEIKDEYVKSQKKMFVRTPIAAAIGKHLGISIEEAKERYLPKISDHTLYHRYLDTANMISLAHENGCVAVLAHPGWIRPFYKDQPLGEEELFCAIANLARNGLDGIEISHRLNDLPMREKLFFLANGLGLIPTGGSDYHGKPRCVFGVNGTTTENFEKLLERIK